MSCFECFPLALQVTNTRRNFAFEWLALIILEATADQLNVAASGDNVREFQALRAGTHT